MNPCRRILLVEDDNVLRRVNTEVLLDSGYSVDAAGDGAVAWAALQLFEYDLLITDYNLPNVSGVNLLQNLYAAGMDLPVIMMSGTLPTAELNRYPWLKIESALRKPHSPAEFLAIVRNVLHSKDSTREQLAPPPNWPHEVKPEINRIQP